MALNDPEVVAREYATETRLEGRREAYRYATGPDAVDMAFEAVVEVAPRSVLEVGCGPGELAARIEATGAAVTAVDISPRMVELARGRGVDASVGDVQQLPFADETFDVVLAAWMLYHVPEPGRGLDELARVIRPGGRLVAVTNGRGHLAELRRLCGDMTPHATSFDDVVGPVLLAERFRQVEARDASGEIRFPDRASVQAYADASITLWPAGSGPLPPFDVPFVVRRVPIVYVGTKAG